MILPEDDHSSTSPLPNKPSILQKEEDAAPPLPKFLAMPTPARPQRPTSLVPTTRTKLRAQVGALTTALLTTAAAPPSLSVLNDRFDELRQKCEQANEHYADLVKLRAELAACPAARAQVDDVVKENLELTKIMVGSLSFVVSAFTHCFLPQAKTYTETVAALNGDTAADKFLAEKIKQKHQTGDRAADVYRTMVTVRLFPPLYFLSLCARRRASPSAFPSAATTTTTTTLRPRRLTDCVVRSLGRPLLV
ncbi:MAG: hypothetical protein AAF242_04115 [Bacteroidota bacterium]